jgi:hypothetical protein
MKTGGFKGAGVLGLAVSALLFAGGCRNERSQGTQQDTQGQQQVLPGQQQAPGTGGAGESGAVTPDQPDDLKQLPDEEGFQSAPEEHELPSGIGQDGRGGSGLEDQEQEQHQEHQERD